MNVMIIRFSSMLLLSSCMLYAEISLRDSTTEPSTIPVQFDYLFHTEYHYEKYNDDELEQLFEAEYNNRVEPKKSLIDLKSPYFYLDQNNLLQCRYPIKEYTLRTIVLDDFETFKKLRSDPYTMSFMAGGTQDEAGSKARFDILLNRVKNNNPMAWLTVEENETKKIVGFAALGLPSSKEPGVGELIVFFEPNTQARGLGTLMLKACLTEFAPEVCRLGKEGFSEFQCFFGKPLHTVYAAINPNNTLALKILQKSPMKQVTEKDSVAIPTKRGYAMPVICFEYALS